MTKSFYDHNEFYTTEALELSNEIKSFIADLFVKYHQQGYSIREIAALTQGVICEQECLSLLLIDPNTKKL